MSILRRTARVAVASSVHGRVQRRQQSRWAADDQTPAVPSYPPLPDPTPGTEPISVDTMIEQLTKLGELHRMNVLTDAEFGAQKALLLARPRP